MYPDIYIYIYRAMNIIVTVIIGTNDGPLPGPRNPTATTSGHVELFRRLSQAFARRSQLIFIHTHLLRPGALRRC